MAGNKAKQHTTLQKKAPPSTGWKNTLLPNISTSTTNINYNNSYTIRASGFESNYLRPYVICFPVFLKQTSKHFAQQLLGSRYKFSKIQIYSYYQCKMQLNKLLFLKLRSYYCKFNIFNNINSFATWRIAKSAAKIFISRTI